jgi:hypothetical protein
VVAESADFDTTEERWMVEEGAKAVVVPLLPRRLSAAKVLLRNLIMIV